MSAHRIDNVAASEMLETIINSSSDAAVPDTYVLRDGNGAIAASSLDAPQIITDDIVSATTLNLGSDITTQTVNVGCGTAVQTVNIGTGAGITTINLGAAGDTVTFSGTVTAVTSAALDVTDQRITLNKGGVAASSGNSGIYIEEAGVDTAYIKVASDFASIRLKAPLSSEISVGNVLAIPTGLTVAGIDLTPQKVEVFGTWSGPRTTGTVPVTFLRIGNLVHLTIGADNAATIGAVVNAGLSEFTFNNISAIPNEVRPRYNNGVTTGPTTRQLTIVKNNNLVDTYGTVVVEPNVTNIDGTVVSSYGALKVQLVGGSFTGTDVGWNYALVVQYQIGITQ